MGQSQVAVGWCRKVFRGQAWYNVTISLLFT